MVSADAVLRDLRAGRGVRRAWAPEAAEALMAQGVVTVRGAWLALADDAEARAVREAAAAARQRARRKRGPRDWHAARAKAEAILEALLAGPVVPPELAARIGCTTQTVRNYLIEMGARRGKRVPGVVWHLAPWRLPPGGLARAEAVVRRIGRRR